MLFSGMTVHKSELAVQSITTFDVVRTAIPKRRKRWRVVKTARQVPGAFQIAGVMYVHPSIYDALLQQVAPKGNP